MAVNINTGAKVVLSVAGAGLKGDKGDDGGGLASVSLEMPTGFSVVGSPASGISGEITVSLAAGYVMMTQAERDTLAALAGGEAPVTSVNGAGGDVVLDFEDVGAEPLRTPASEPEALAGTETAIRSWSPLRVRQAADEAVEDALGGSLGAIIGAISITGAYLGRVNAPVGTGNIVGWTGLNGVKVLRIDGLLFGHAFSTPDDSGYSYPVMRCRFTNDGGSSWGAWQDPAPWVSPFTYAYAQDTSLPIFGFINLETGAYSYFTKDSLPHGTFTVPANCNGVQFSLPGSQGGFAISGTIIEGR